MGTIREDITELLLQRELDAREISGEIGVSEKDVVAHLDHISRSLSRRGLKLVVTPARCFSCGYTFKDRSRPKKPGRCPKCRSEHIDPPRFSIK
ncbi:MAG: transcriptional regulator [Desulfobacterales bacterium]|nr:transcriptional regulator [Desulfobacterales bacterium]